MNLNQTKLVGLTLELEVKAREYKILCNLLEKIKAKNVEPNDERLLELKKLFEENQNEIIAIQKQLEELQQQ